MHPPSNLPPLFSSRMPHHRPGEISGKSNYQGGSRGRFELTPNCRFHIVGRAAGGQTVRAISQDLNIAPSTMQIIVGELLHCCLLHEVLPNPNIRYKNLWLNLGLNGRLHQGPSYTA